MSVFERPSAWLATPPEPAAEQPVTVLDTPGLRRPPRVRDFVTAEFLRAAMPACLDAGAWVEPLIAAFDRFDVSSQMSMCVFIAQAGHESRDLQRLEESLNYRADRLYAMFGHRVSRTTAFAIGRVEGPNGHPADERAIAEAVYGMRDDLGNTEPGDGARFIGRGIFQITGRYNYQQVADHFGLRLEDVPDWLRTREGAAMAAGQYWQRRGFSMLADSHAFDEISRRINGAKTVEATHGLADRRDRLARARTAMFGRA